MKRALLVAKLLIIFITAVVLFGIRDYHRYTEISDGYALPVSVFPGEPVSLYFNAQKTNSRATFRLYDLWGNKTDSIKSHAVVSDTNEQASSNGFGYPLTTTYTPADSISGLYFWNYLVPVIIKNQNAEIIIVYPYNSKHGQSDIGGNCFFKTSNNKTLATTLSYERPLTIDKNSQDFFRWISENLEKSKISFATENDIEKLNQNFPKARLLIFGGDTPFWTKEQRNAVDDFISNGGNALFMSGLIMNNKLRKKDPNKIVFRKEPNEIKNHSLVYNYFGSKENNYYSIGADYKFGGVKDDHSKREGFRIVNPESPLLRNTGLKKDDSLTFSSVILNGSPLRQNDQGLSIDNDSIHFFRTEIIALSQPFQKPEKNGIIGVYQRENYSGYIVMIGSSEWILKENLTKKEIQTITLNAIDLLSKKKIPFTQK